MPISDDQVPQDILEKMLAWRKWRSFWNWVHFGLGSIGVALSTVVAANTNKAFLCPGWSVTIAVAAAVFAFLINALSAAAKAASFETASREIEKAIALFKGGCEEKTLYEAEARGIDILNKIK